VDSSRNGGDWLVDGALNWISCFEVMTGVGLIGVAIVDETRGDKIGKIGVGWTGVATVDATRGDIVGWTDATTLDETKGETIGWTGVATIDETRGIVAGWNGENMGKGGSGESTKYDGSCIHIYYIFISTKTLNSTKIR
jgi:hypothetical protein